jgi:hypothetical protein
VPKRTDTLEILTCPVDLSGFAEYSGWLLGPVDEAVRVTVGDAELGVRCAGFTYEVALAARR